MAKNQNEKLKIEKKTIKENKLIKKNHEKSLKGYSNSSITNSTNDSISSDEETFEINQNNDIYEDYNDSDNSDDNEESITIDEEELLNHIIEEKMKEYESIFDTSSENNKISEENNVSINETATKSSSDKQKIKCTVFKDPTKKYSRNLLDSKNDAASSIPTSIKELKMLKRKRTQELEELQKEKKLKRKSKFRAETYLKDKDEYQMEMMKFRFEMKNMLLKDSMTEEEYKKFLRDEYEKQGKQWTGEKEKKENKNYKDLKQERQMKKEARKQDRQNAFLMGAITKNDLKREKWDKEKAFRKERENFFMRFGTPHSMGMEDGKLRRNKAFGKGIGVYKNGMLKLSRKEIDSVSKKISSKRK